MNTNIDSAISVVPNYKLLEANEGLVRRISETTFEVVTTNGHGEKRFHDLPLRDLSEKDQGRLQCGSRVRWYTAYRDEGDKRFKESQMAIQ